MSEPVSLRFTPSFASRSPHCSPLLFSTGNVSFIKIDDRLFTTLDFGVAHLFSFVETLPFFPTPLHHRVSSNSSFPFPSLRAVGSKTSVKRTVVGYTRWVCMSRRTGPVLAGVQRRGTRRGPKWETPLAAALQGSREEERRRRWRVGPAGVESSTSMKRCGQVLGSFVATVQGRCC